MKKIVFILMTVFALALMAGSAVAQTSVTPYLGAAYTYSVADIEPGSANLVEVYISSDAAWIQLLATAASDYEIVSSTGATLTTAGGQGYRGALTSSDITFNILYPGTSNLTVGSTYYLWVKVYSGNESTCSNIKYITIVPAANNFDLALQVKSINVR